MFGTKYYSFNQRGINALIKDIKKDRNNKEHLMLVGGVIVALTIGGVLSINYTTTYFACESTRELVKWMV
jgi:hypothetical protein